jgi:hypothetical protein
MNRSMLSKLAPLKLRVLLLKGDYGWVAQCLELDLGAQGRSISEALRALAQTFIGQAVVDVAAGRVPFEDFKPAPRWYFDQYESEVAVALVPPDEVVAALTTEPIHAEADVRIAA